MSEQIDYSGENFKIPDYPNRMETLLDIHKELAVAKEEIYIQVLMEFLTLLDDDSISQRIKDKINNRLDELESARKFSSHL
jgi:hypothetical protein